MDLKEMVLSALSDLQTQEAARKANEKPMTPEAPPSCELHPPSDEVEPVEPVTEPAPIVESLPAPEASSAPAAKVEEAVAAMQVDDGALLAALAELRKEEKLYLSDLRERLLVLFEGLQSPNNKQIEAKVDLILNFLEYLLANTEDRLESLDRD